MNSELRVGKFVGFATANCGLKPTTEPGGCFLICRMEG